MLQFGASNAITTQLNTAQQNKAAAASASAQLQSYSVQRGV